jgi:hypothetical protein
MVFVKLISLLKGVSVGGYEQQWIGMNIGRSSSGLPMILCLMQNFSGSSSITGQTFLATGLYFFLVDRKRSV